MNIYLDFDGNCLEVFNFYRNVFGGEFAAYQTFGDGPPDMGVPEDGKDRVMHVSLPLGDAMLMGSDTFPGSPTPLNVGNNFSIVVPAASRAQCDEYFAALSDNGEILMPMEETFWGSYFGRCRDQYGITWMFNYDLSQEA